LLINNLILQVIDFDTFLVIIIF